MIFSYNFLQSFFDEKLPEPQKLADLLIMHFFEVEGVEKVGKDTAIDIDILPSRAGDCLSHKGVAREISAITGMKLIFPQVKLKEKGDISKYVEVKADSACNRYTMRVIDNVKVGPSPAHIQEKLITCGLKPINNIVDITNYVMLETGQPLHAFDGEKVEGGKINVRYAKNREKMVTLDEKRHELDKDILVISDEVSSIGIAGIKGGVLPEVDENTKTIFLESANFDRQVIRRGARKLGLRTDASVRFEHGMSTVIAQEAVDRAASMIADIAGGEVVKGRVDIANKKEESVSISFTAQDVNNILGVDIPLTEIERILRSLDFKIKRNKSSFNVEAPLFRKDVVIKEDVIEEIGRIYGYENIEPKTPCAELISPKKSSSLALESCCLEEMKALGFTEAYNYTFINEETASFFEYKGLQEMEKPVSLDYKYLRPSLLPGVIKSVGENEKIVDKFSFFEIGKVFSGVKERKVIAGASFPSSFLEMKGVVNLFLERIGIKEVSYNPSSRNFLGACAEIKHGKEVVGIIGEVSSKTKKGMGIKSPVVVFELEMEKLKTVREDSVYNPINRFPGALRDISLLVPRETKYIEAEKKIKREGGSLLSEVSLFDLYEGEEIPEGMKSFAFRLLFQSNSRTLSSEEVNKIRDKIISSLDSVPEWKVRK